MPALQEAALAAGRRMEDKTVRLLARATGGFPYALQMYGFAAWEESLGNDRIGVESAPMAIRMAASEIDRVLYGPARRQCSPRERDYLDVVAGVRQRRTGPGGQRARSGGSDRNGGAGLRRGGVQLWGMYVPPLGAPRWTNEKREKCTDRGLQAWRHAGTAGHGILCGREPTSNTSRHSVQRRLTREYGWGNVCRGRFVERSTKRCGEELAVTHGLDTARYVAASRGGEVFSVVVVVMGVGPLGMCHCIKAQAIGAGTLIAIDTSPVRLRAAATVLGAAITIDAAELARVERRDAVHDATGGGAPMSSSIAQGPWTDWGRQWTWSARVAWS